MDATGPEPQTLSSKSVEDSYIECKTLHRTLPKSHLSGEFKCMFLGPNPRKANAEGLQWSLEFS